jgi:hypothetical protein
MPQPFIWITLIPSAVLFALWMSDRTRFSKKVRELSTQQSETSRMLHELIDESGKITQAFARLLPKASSPALSVGFNNNRAAKTERKGVEKRHMVMHLAQKGHSRKEIAEHLQMPAGEVDLILNLNQGRRTQVTA